MEKRQGDVGERWVGNKCQTSNIGSCVTNRGQVWCYNFSKVVLVEAEGSVHRGQGRDADRRDVSECHVGSPNKVREGDIQEFAVGVNVERLSDVRNLSAECLETIVIVDVQCSHCRQVDTVKSAQEGVGDEHTACLRNRSREGKLRQSWERSP